MENRNYSILILDTVIQYAKGLQTPYYSIPLVLLIVLSLPVYEAQTAEARSASRGEVLGTFWALSAFGLC